MAKAEWGTKHTCSSCSAKFYDMQRAELICPKCGQKNQPQVVFKQRRASEAVKDPKPAAKVAAAPADDADDDAEDVNTDDDTLLDSDDDDDTGLDVGAGTGDDDEDAIVPVEDASEVGLDSTDEEEEDL